jgi:putative nucleotidyltransferase with HDIG domain
LARALQKEAIVTRITEIPAEPRRPRVLVVDDELGPRESLRMILRPAYEVLTASDGSEALEVLRTTPVDLATVDLNMPGIQGEELMRVIRREFPSVEVIVITGYGSVDSAVESLRFGICDYIQKPFDVVKVLTAVSRGLSSRQGRRQLTGFLERLGELLGRGEEVHRILDRIERSPRMRHRVGDLLTELEETRPGEERERVRTSSFLEVLAETIEAQHEFMRGHAQRTSFYAGLLCDRLCLSAREQEHVRMAGFLHDVGKVGVPSELLARRGALDPQERRAVEQHPVIGVGLVDPLGLPTEVSMAIRHHHEWWDGRGYPDGLYGGQIPLPARIVAVADAYDAMTSDRPYRRALTQEVAVEELQRFSGVQFDPVLVKEFLCIVEATDVDLQVLADSVAAREDEEEPAAPSAQ